MKHNVNVERLIKWNVEIGLWSIEIYSRRVGIFGRHQIPDSTITLPTDSAITLSTAPGRKSCGLTYTGVLERGKRNFAAIGYILEA